MPKTARNWMIIACALAMSACSSNPATTASGASGPAGGADPAKAGSAPVAAVQAQATATATPATDAAAKPRSASHRDAGGELAARSVYFDYDRFAIRNEFVPLLRKHAEYLLRQPDLTVQVQGHADERGSREYNLALGQKRAEAEKRALEGYGVPGRRIEAVSYGEEKPKATGHDESSWTENRRGDLLYSGEF